MSTREVITLQLGHYANFVGTHWWNTQEASFVYSPAELTGPKEINHDVLFREGQNLVGDVTYTPRLVLFDLKGSLNTLKHEGALYDFQSEEEDINWNSDVTMHKFDTGQKNEFLLDLERQEPEYKEIGAGDQRESDTVETEEKDDTQENPVSDQDELEKKDYDLDEKVSVWSDYLRLHLHPKTIQILQEYQHENELQPFDIFTQGQQAFNDQKVNTDFENRMHFFAEECDHMQGIQVLVDTYNGFGGLGNAVVEQFQDDYSGKGISVFGLAPPTFPEYTSVQSCQRLLNTLLSVEKLSSSAKAFVPMSVGNCLGRRPAPPYEYPHLTYKSDLPYHTSAVLGTVIDTMTLPYRLETNPQSMNQLIDSITPHSRKILGAYAALPFPIETKGNLVQSLMSAGDSLPWQPVSPMCSTNVNPLVQSVVLRGITPDKTHGPPNQDVPSLLKNCSGADELVQLYLKELCPKTLSAVCTLQQKSKVTTPYPHIFNETVTGQGYISENERLPTEQMDSVPVMTSLQNTPSSGDFLEKLYEDCSKLNIKKFHRFLDAGIEEDDYKEVLNNVKSLAGNYSDSGNDMP